MKTIKITAYVKTYEGKNNTDDPDNYDIFDEVEFSENLADLAWDYIGDWPHIEEIDHCLVEELESGVYKNSEEYETDQLHLLFNQ